MKNVYMSALILFLLAGFACPGLAAEKPRLRLPYVEWVCSTASTYLAKAVLEDKLGYDVELVSTVQPMIMKSLAAGDSDASFSLWLPQTHRDDYEKVKNRTELLNVLATGARLGLVVPNYVPLKSIEELRDHADKFKKNIVGIDPGSGIMRLTEKAITAYNLPYNLVEGSDATMTAMLGDAIRRKEWIVITGWSPHWMFGRWGLHYLEDSKKSYGDAETVYIIARQGLKKDHPKVWNLLKRMHYANLAQFEDYINWNTQPGTTPEENARKFIKTYPDLIADWLK